MLRIKPELTRVVLIVLIFRQNYRLNLTNEEVRTAVAEGDVQLLWEADQLRLAMVHREAFVGYNEAQIAFA